MRGPTLLPLVRAGITEPATNAPSAPTQAQPRLITAFLPVIRGALAPYMRFLCDGASFLIVSIRVLVPSSGETKEGS